MEKRTDKKPNLLFDMLKDTTKNILSVRAMVKD